MGQYYKACFKAKDAEKWNALVSYDCGQGAKLMEHSYIGNSFVGQLMARIFRNPQMVVWAGDYADYEVGYEETKEKIYTLAEDVEPWPENLLQKKSEHRFVINHTKGLFIDLNKVKEDKYGYRINPLPLLTAEGNGRGGGDYRGTLIESVGTWARDLIEVNSENPTDYKEVEFDFVED